MEIKVGDKVRVSKDAPKIYTKDGFNFVTEMDFEVVEIEDGCAKIQNENGVLTIGYVIKTKYLIKVEDEAKAKYRMGDRVYVLGSELLKRGVYTIIGVEHRERLGWYYQINIHEWHPEIDLEPYAEPTAPTIKVGDFVRVLENLHEPICLDVERHLEITNVPPHAVSQKEWKVISVEMRRDCAGRIYTLKHDDSFIYNIPEDCVELVQPKEQTEKDARIRQMEAELDEFRKAELDRVLHPEKYHTYAVTIDNVAVDWQRYEADLAKEIALKVANKHMDGNPEEIGAYAVSVAKAVVENLKKE